MQGMQGNAALEKNDVSAQTSGDDLHDAWFDAPPPSAVRPRIVASEPPPMARAAAVPAIETEIDPFADAWFR